MKSTSIHLLVTFDQNYIAPFETMLTSILLNNPGEQFHVWLLHSAIPQTALDALEHDCCAHGVPLTPIAVDRQLFQGAPITKQYPQEMYCDVGWTIRICSTSRTAWDWSCHSNGGTTIG